MRTDTSQTFKVKQSKVKVTALPTSNLEKIVPVLTAECASGDIFSRSLRQIDLK